MIRRRSIRSELVTRLLLGLLLLSAVSAAVIYALARRTLTDQFDSALLAKARALATLVEEEDRGKYEFEFADEIMPEFNRERSPEYFQIRLSDGRVLERSRSLKGRDLPRFAGEQTLPEFRDLQLPDGTRGRAVAFPFAPQSEGDEREEKRHGVAETHPARSSSAAPVTIMLARSRAPLDRTLAAVLSVLVAGGLLVPLGGAGLVLLTVTRALRPLDGLADRVRSLGPSTLGERFRPESAPKELEPIQKRLNELLDRLQAAFERERRFSSDVSHELRTPLAEVKAAVELAARWPDDEELHRQACRDALDAADHMQELIARLLLLVRSESGTCPLKVEPLDLAAMTDMHLRPFKPLAAERRLTLSVSASGPVWIETDKTLFSTVLRNLLENAVTYAPPGTGVEIQVRENEGRAEWIVRNEAPELKESETVEMFHPFWRKDQARSGEETHVGLGLSLVTSFCRLLGIGLESRLAPDGTLSILLRMPQSAARADMACSVGDRQHSEMK